MANVDLKGLGVALVTPFNNDESVDYEALKRMVNHIIEGRADYIVVLGTTAETPTLQEDEKIIIREIVKETCNGRLPLILGLGGNCTHHIVKELKETNLNGFSAILSVTPYYNRPSQEGLFQHYSKLAENSPLPLVLYNVPTRTGVNLSAETTLRLSENFDNIIAIKEASGNLEQIDKILKNKKNGFQVVSGDDSNTLELIKRGANGVISVIGNAFPEKFGNMVRLCIKGKFDEASVINDELKDFYHLSSVDGNPSGIKCFLHEMGLINNILRLPLVPVSEYTHHKIKEKISL